jgi:hypothetical protein
MFSERKLRNQPNRCLPANVLPALMDPEGQTVLSRSGIIGVLVGNLTERFRSNTDSEKGRGYHYFLKEESESLGYVLYNP